MAKNKNIIAASFMNLALIASPAALLAETVVQRDVVLYEVVPHRIFAINYDRSEDSKLGLKGTSLAAAASGSAKIDGHERSFEIKAKLKGLPAVAHAIGPDALTYVLWAVTPEGRAQNLGELDCDGDECKLHTQTALSSFALMVTAEPYFAVTLPSDMVVAQSVLTGEVAGTIETIDSTVELVARGEYGRLAPAGERLLVMNPGHPSVLLQARAAVQIARWHGAARHAPQSLAKAEQRLALAEAQMAAGESVDDAARAAVQTAEDSRLASIELWNAEQLQAERTAAASREAQAVSAEIQERNRRIAAQSARLQAERDAARARSVAVVEMRRRQTAERQANESALDAATAEVALHATAKALDETSQELNETAGALAQAEHQAVAEHVRADKLELEAIALKAQILSQLTFILDARETTAGLVSAFPEVYFDTDAATLGADGQTKLRNITAIMKGNPGLFLYIDGHADSRSSDDHNLALSARRAKTVLDYLVAQGVPTRSVSVTAQGEGQPAASNVTPVGRKLNRRVELTLVGDSIGIPMHKHM